MIRKRFRCRSGPLVALDPPSGILRQRCGVAGVDAPQAAGRGGALAARGRGGAGLSAS